MPTFEDYLKLDIFNFSGTQSSSASVLSCTNEVEFSENSHNADLENDINMNHEHDIELTTHTHIKKHVSGKRKQQSSKPKPKGKSNKPYLKDILRSDLAEKNFIRSVKRYYRNLFMKSTSYMTMERRQAR